MPELVPIFLILHILGAIVAFGPSFSLPILGRMVGAEPQHGNFGLRAALRTTDRIVIPFALSMPVTGIGLIWAAGWDLTAPASRWLLLAIAVYVVALSIALLLQRPTVKRLVDLTSSPPPAGSPPGPPPGVPEAAALVRRNGLILQILIVVIVILMVTKPSLGA
jgi:uncharacterized membrane protein